MREGGWLSLPCRTREVEGGGGEEVWGEAGGRREYGKGRREEVGEERGRGKDDEQEEEKRRIRRRRGRGQGPGRELERGQEM
eukprot:2663463-Karenia_brevis.AAC.1